MKFAPSAHLTYCTNIHPGEHWSEVMKSLQDYTIPLKNKLCPNEPFGVGLRLSNIASEEILTDAKLEAFKDWLGHEDLYIFTMNGFPYGGFHHTKVKDRVHHPDWSTDERCQYTCRLFDILAYLIPDDMDGGISTSPISYRHWHEDSEKLATVWEKSCTNLAKVAAHLFEKKHEQGVLLHLDIEPEPDGLLENTEEVIEFYEKRLIPIGSAYLEKSLGVSRTEATDILYEHIQICYDVCHFAVVYESPKYTFHKWAEAGIRIGKVQISAALKAAFPAIVGNRKDIVTAFEQLNESTYLHQVVASKADGSFQHFTDLPTALSNILDPETIEWRTHFHVPIFVDSYDHLSSTRSTIEEVLQDHLGVTNHWEVETYTWEVLPKSIRFGLQESIERELRWVLEKLA